MKRIWVWVTDRMKGRKPKPTKLKVLQGNPGHRALNQNEPEPELPLPNPPECLDAMAIAEWNRLAPELSTLGMLTGLDTAVFAGYCQLFSDWYSYCEKLKKVPHMLKTENGNWVQNPLVGMRNRTYKLLKEYEAEIGLTGSSRSRISVKPKEKKKTSAWEGFGG